MDQIVPVDVTRFVLDLHRDFSVTPRASKPGPPQRIDGVTIGFVSVTERRASQGRSSPGWRRNLVCDFRKVACHWRIRAEQSD